ncbi:Distal-less [Nesidiocoris tenuis]|uniref:Distal-less n=1 Tax=Nesidiocoris tenuis TaxID=355587 RepID=A0ABN7B0K0_9HEMI|nr:Distal-less [Nesidiocoris tenuis]
MDHHPHMGPGGQGGQMNHGQDNPGNITPGPPPPSSKSAFIELQQHGPYNPVRSYHHHFGGQQTGGGGQGGNPGHHEAPGFASPRAALSAYPFAPMHHNTYAGYHLGTYAPQCPSPPKDGKSMKIGA